MPPPLPGNFHRIPVGTFPLSHAAPFAQSHLPIGPFYPHQHPHMYYSSFSSTFSNPTSHQFHQQPVTRHGPSTAASTPRPQPKGNLRQPSPRRRVRTSPASVGGGVEIAENPATPVRRVSFSRDTKPDTSMHDNLSYPRPVRRKPRSHTSSSLAGTMRTGGTHSTVSSASSVAAGRHSSRGRRRQSARHEDSTFHSHSSSSTRRRNGRHRTH